MSYEAFLIPNILVLHVYWTDTIHRLQKDGIIITMEDMTRLSPYLTRHIKRFEDFVLDLDAKPMDVERIKKLKIFD